MTADAAAELSRTASKNIAVVPCESWLDPRCCRGMYQLHGVTMGALKAMRWISHHLKTAVAREVGRSSRHGGCPVITARQVAAQQLDLCPQNVDKLPWIEATTWPHL